MLQIKSFKENTKLSTVNKFLKTVTNAKILSTNPFMVEYEIIEEKPLREYKLQKLTNFGFQAGSKETGINDWGLDGRVWGNFQVKASKILIYEDYICFESKNDIAFYNFETGEIFDKNNKKVLEYEFSDKGEKYKLEVPESFDINDEEWFREITEENIVGMLEDYGLLNPEKVKERLWKYYNNDEIPQIRNKPEQKEAYMPRRHPLTAHEHRLNLLEFKGFNIIQTKHRSTF